MSVENSTKEDTMQKFLSTISSSQLFKGVSYDEIDNMLKCFNAKEISYAKDEYILHAGERVNAIGLVLCGSILIIQEDVWGNRQILSKLGPSKSFAAAFACAKNAILNVSVVAEEPATIMFLSIKQVLNICSSTCTYHSNIVQNLLSELANKNLSLSKKVWHMGQRNTREKLMSYFSTQAQECGTYEFDIPFTRQQLAEYLAVDRSGLSTELGKMRDEGLIEFSKNHFVINVNRK